jgi:hypothetical protein
MCASRPETVSNGQCNIILSTDVQDIVPMLVREVLSVVHEAELGMYGAPTGDDACDAVCSQWDEPQEHSRVNCEVVHSLCTAHILQPSTA